MVRSGEPTIIQVANSWLIVNVGGGPTHDKPIVTLLPPVNLHEVWRDVREQRWRLRWRFRHDARLLAGGGAPIRQARPEHLLLVHRERSFPGWSKRGACGRTGRGRRASRGAR